MSNRSSGRRLRRPVLIAWALAGLTACGGGGGDDAGLEQDGGGARDAGVVADSAIDGGPAVCGDGSATGGELCDGDTVSCASLSAQYVSGEARCRSACEGYDVSTCGAGPLRQWEMIKPAERDPRWADARCNDGTPFDFLYRPGAAGSNVWVIYLQGGGFGDDVAFATSERGAALTSTTPVPDRSLGPVAALEHGLFGDAGANPDFADAHMVFAHYCSSDLYTGRGTERRPVAGSAEGYFFAGRHNVRAMVEILAQRYALDDANPDLELLWGGASAGCIGATQTADIAAGLLPQTAASARLAVLADGAYLVAPPTDDDRFYWGAAAVSDIALLNDAITYWDAEPLPACASTERGECYYGRGWYPALTDTMGLPVVVLMSNMDEVVLGLRGLCAEGCGAGAGPCFPGCTSLSAEDYASWRAAHRAEWSELGVAWLFAWGSPEHTGALVDDRWNGPPGAAEPMRGLVADFFFERTAPRQVYVNGADL